MVLVLIAIQLIMVAQVCLFFLKESKIVLLISLHPIPLEALISVRVLLHLFLFFLKVNVVIKDLLPFVVRVSVVFTLLSSLYSNHLFHFSSLINLSCQWFVQKLSLFGSDTCYTNWYYCRRCCWIYIANFLMHLCVQKPTTTGNNTTGIYSTSIL